MTITLKTSEKTKNMMIDFYNDLKREKTPQYAVFQAVDGDTVVTLYESGKAVFQGKDADLASDYWIETEKINSGYATVTNSEKKKKEPIVYEDKKEATKYLYTKAVGSDEVGTGDYFGPIVVTASYVKKDDIPYLKELGVTDSKKLTDEKIKEIAPKISKKILYKSLILGNEKYNLYHKEYNMNKVKAIMHNKVLYDIMQENIQVDYIIVDEFASEKNYYAYLKDTNLVQKGITFLTKAETKNLAVASSSIISRYIFLTEWEKLENSLHLNLPKGAGFEVDKVGKEIIEKYGIKKLNSIAKLNFKNTERIINN